MRKNFEYYSKYCVTLALRIARKRNFQILFLGFILTWNLNSYYYEKNDYLVMNALGSNYIYKKVCHISQKYQIDPFLVASVIISESSAYPFAISHKNAKGLMQLMDETALYIAKRVKKEWYEEMVKRPSLIYDPAINIELAVIHLKDMYRYMKEKEWHSALHIYNLSIYAFKKGQRNHSYVNRIINRIEQWKN